MKLCFLASLILCASVSCAAQTHFYIDGEVGSGSLGFKTPHMALGAAVEQAVFNRVELTGKFIVSPDVKRFARSGHGFSFGTSVGILLTQRLSIHGGVEYNIYYSAVPNARVLQSDGQYKIFYTPYSKGGVAPFAGFSLKDNWFSSPGRATLDYFPETHQLHLEKLFPSECVFATAANPCSITSPQEQAIIGSQEFELWPRIHIGARGGWVQYGDQVNPFAKELGQKRHNTGFADFIFRFELTKP